MPSETWSPTKKFISVPALVLFVVTAFAAVALSIALIIIQLQDNIVLNIRERDFGNIEVEDLGRPYELLTEEEKDDKGKPKYTHPFGPVITICAGDQYILPITVRCFIYKNGIPDKNLDSRIPRAFELGARIPCWNNTGDTYKSYIIHNKTKFYYKDFFEKKFDPDPTRDEQLTEYPGLNATARKIIPPPVLPDSYYKSADRLPANYVKDITTPFFYTASCISVTKRSFPNRFQNGVVSQISFQSMTDAENAVTDAVNNLPFIYRNDGVYTIRLWNNASLTIEEVDSYLSEAASNLTNGNYIEVPASMAGSYTTFADAIDGRCTSVHLDRGYSEHYISPGVFQCLKTEVDTIRAGVEVDLVLSERTNRKWGEKYENDYGIRIDSVKPTFNYVYDPSLGIVVPNTEDYVAMSAWRQAPLKDQSSFAVFTFRWNSEQVLLYEEVQSLSSSAMAAILLGSLTALFSALAKTIDLYLMCSEDPS